jgi:hypothetical protein
VIRQTMTDPITPPLELVQQWKRTAPHPINEREHYHYITFCAAQWGADQDLEACKQWLSLRGHAELAIKLGYCMRNKPQPPSLKEQALAALEVIPKLVGFESERNAIRRALEALDD